MARWSNQSDGPGRKECEQFGVIDELDRRSYRSGDGNNCMSIVRPATNPQRGDHHAAQPTHGHDRQRDRERTADKGLQPGQESGFTGGRFGSTGAEPGPAIGHGPAQPLAVPLGIAGACGTTSLCFIHCMNKLCHPAGWTATHRFSLLPGRELLRS